MPGGWDVIAVEMKEVVDPVMGREETLRLSGRRVGQCEFSALLFGPLCLLRGKRQ